MKEVAQLLNDMMTKAVIQDYALFGAAAQMRYTEPVATLDVDVLVGLPGQESIDMLAPIYRFCSDRGFKPEGESIRVGAWPVQFLPAYSHLTREAMRLAETADFDGTPLRVVRADYLAVIALSVGRSKDFARILALLESNSVRRDQVAQLAKENDLAEAWKRFETRFLQ